MPVRESAILGPKGMNAYMFPGVDAQYGFVLTDNGILVLFTVRTIRVSVCFDSGDSVNGD
jgi:hypothetical protein